MIDMLVGGELPAGAFVAAFPNMTQPAISQHLKVLRDAGMVEVRADKQRRLYSLKSEALAPLRDWLAPHAPAAATTAIETVEPTQAKKPKPKAKPKPLPEPELTLDLFG
ncbi:metalloregulator ArsR/SmtB family transcription factor [Pelagibacterium sp. H642]|uniref:ArsR/SmtB family transcription factor n=1 Tax=Pelagibacterium sp. H642 TaxID=1881069 RepID=UPI002815ED64|nr:metalloregulator ArsR/SmtB family transcription factor [Pelagibacterium sp. H642]WMT90684.1 ArsR family transcriptional regulator [Pelagibacterium sp. H642]